MGNDSCASRFPDRSMCMCVWYVCMLISACFPSFPSSLTTFPLASLYPLHLRSPPWDLPLQSIIDQFGSGDTKRMGRVWEEGNGPIRVSKTVTHPLRPHEQDVQKNGAAHTDVKGCTTPHITSHHPTQRHDCGAWPSKGGE